MNSTYDIPIQSLIFYVFLFIIPVMIFKYLKIRKVKSLIISIARMVFQLSMVGVYLGYIFHLNNIFINIGWIVLMIFVANISILDQSGLSIRKLSYYTIPAYFITVVVVLASFLIIFSTDTIFSARYLIPLGGMVLGNLLRSNIVGLDRFFSELRKRENEYIQYISLGAQRSEAVIPFLREAYKAAMAPQIAGLAIMGLVALPGMMTGQILGGSSPMLAIKYQIMIMTAIFVTTSVSVLLALIFSMNSAFDSFGRFRKDIFKDHRERRKKHD
ncbi:MAG: ABC transporter permease [Candidatus Cloacimonetes bacterium]|nr:ABC transporter permease [Candidatus Cloacimonadota bacterium]